MYPIYINVSEIFTTSIKYIFLTFRTSLYTSILHEEAQNSFKIVFSQFTGAGVDYLQ